MHKKEPTIKQLHSRSQYCNENEAAAAKGVFVNKANCPASYKLCRPTALYIP